MNKRTHEKKAEAVASACNFIKIEPLPPAFSSEFCEIFKNSFSYRTHPVVASKIWKIVKPIALQIIFFTEVIENRVSDHYARNV